MTKICYGCLYVRHVLPCFFFNLFSFFFIFERCTLGCHKTELDETLPHVSNSKWSRSETKRPCLVPFSQSVVLRNMLNLRHASRNKTRHRQTEFLNYERSPHTPNTWWTSAHKRLILRCSFLPTRCNFRIARMAAIATAPRRYRVCSVSLWLSVEQPCCWRSRF